MRLVGQIESGNIREVFMCDTASIQSGAKEILK